MKPIVHYKSLGFTITVGSRAIVEVLDHPRDPEVHNVSTSQVVSVDEETGNFETLNTLYVRKNDAS